MARPKKNATVNEEVVAVPAEEKKAKRPGRPRKSAVPAEKAEVKEETAEVAAEAPVEAAPEAKEEVKPKRGRKKKTETEAAAVEQKTTKKKTTEKKTEEKQPARRGRKKAEEVKKEITTIVQYRGNQIEEKDMIEKVESAWKAEGNKTPIETITMYVKPEDGKIYYVVNGLSGSVDLF